MHVGLRVFPRFWVLDFTHSWFYTSMKARYTASVPRWSSFSEQIQMPVLGKIWLPLMVPYKKIQGYDAFFHVNHLPYCVYVT